MKKIEWTTQKSHEAVDRFLEEWLKKAVEANHLPGFRRDENGHWQECTTGWPEAVSPRRLSEAALKDAGGPISLATLQNRLAFFRVWDSKSEMRTRAARGRATKVRLTPVAPKEAVAKALGL